jgi:hypothetical protein
VRATALREPRRSAAAAHRARAWRRMHLPLAEEVDDDVIMNPNFKAFFGA